MSYITVAAVKPLFIGTEEVWETGTVTVVLAANAVTLFAFEVPAPMVFSGGSWYIGATATGTTDLVVYSFAGTTKFASTGATANVANSQNNVAFAGGNLTLAPGQYYLGLCCSNATDTYGGKGPTSSKLYFASRFRLATNTGTAGVTPATTGGYGLVTGNVPAMSLTIVGGIV